MIIDFDEGKEAKAERDQFLEQIQNFISLLSQIKLAKEYVYVKTLSALFRSMRHSKFSEEAIDEVLYRAACDQKVEIRAANSNSVVPEWYT